MKAELASLDPADRTSTRVWELDLSLAGKVSGPGKRPTKHRRQRIASFIERNGDVERFAIRQTLPYRGYEGEAYPSQSQYGAVMDFFIECCETRHQAHTMLCARDYAQIVSRSVKFTAPRREFIWLCTAAFLLADKDLRSRVRSWNARRFTSIEVGIANHAPYKRAQKFVSQLIDDMRSQGSEIFG